MKTDCYLGLDLGGTGAKAGVFDRSGALRGFGRQPYTPVVSPDGLAELPIEVIYEAARSAVRQAVGRHAVRVRAMAISSQGQTFVSLDSRDRPLHRAILWYDSRAKAQASRMQQAWAARARPARGRGERRWPAPEMSPIATAPKIMWLREHEPARMRRARRFLLLPDYLTYRLTGLAVTEPNTATSTGLYADGAPGYDPRALSAAGIDEEQIARIELNGTRVETVLPARAEEWGLSSETLLVTGTNDQYAGALGAGNCRCGILTETTGTCLALVTLTRKLPSPMPAGLYGGCFPIPGYQFALTFAKTAGLVLDWFRRELAPDSSLADLTDEAGRIPIGARGLTAIPHFDGAVSPVPDAGMRGAFVGLTLQHGRADLYRALLESLSFSLRENLEFMRKCGFRIDTVRSLGGGAKSDLWLQMKADVIGVPVEKPSVPEAAILGAAMLAALGSGQFSSLAEASAALYRRERVFRPASRRVRAYEEPFRRYVALSRFLLGRPT